MVTEFDDVSSVLGRFPTVTVDMDTHLHLGSRAIIEVIAHVKEIRHDTSPETGVRRIHIFEIETMKLSSYVDDEDDRSFLCITCESVTTESEGKLIGSEWVCQNCIERAVPWSKPDALNPTPTSDTDKGLEHE